MALRKLYPAFPLIQPILSHVFVCPNLVYEAPILVTVFDFVIIRAIMTVVKNEKSHCQASALLESGCHQAVNIIIDNYEFASSSARVTPIKSQMH